MLADELRTLIGASATEYTIGEVAYWTDEQLDDALDRRKGLHTQARVEPRWERIEGEHVARFAQVKAAGAFEPGEIGELRDRDGYAIEDWAVDQQGLVTFETPLTRDTCHVSWTGYTFDLYAAASDVLGAWAVHLKDSVDLTVTTDGQSIKESASQKVATLTGRADYFARGAVLAWVGSSGGSRVHRR